MALDVGALGCGDFGSYHAEPVDPRSGVAEPSVFIFPYGILVNKDGLRFTDEAPGTVDAVLRADHAPHLRAARRASPMWSSTPRHSRIPNYRLGIRTDKPPVAARSIAELAGRSACRRSGWCDGRRVQPALRGRRIPAAGARRPRHTGLDAAQIQLGAASRRGAVPCLSDHLRERVHVWRPEGGSEGARARPRRRADPRPLRRRRNHRASTTATTPARHRF